MSDSQPDTIAAARLLAGDDGVVNVFGRPVRALDDDAAYCITLRPDGTTRVVFHARFIEITAGGYVCRDCDAHHFETEGDA